MLQYCNYPHSLLYVRGFVLACFIEFYSLFAFSASTRLGVTKSIRPVTIEWWGVCGYLSGARSRLFAYGPADAIAITKPHHLLLHLKSRLGLPFCYWLTRVILEKRPLNGCSDSSTYTLYTWLCTCLFFKNFIVFVNFNQSILQCAAFTVSMSRDVNSWEIGREKRSRLASLVDIPIYVSDVDYYLSAVVTVVPGIKETTMLSWFFFKKHAPSLQCAVPVWQITPEWPLCPAVWYAACILLVTVL